MTSAVIHHATPRAQAVARPLLLADWRPTLMIHYRIAPETLQPHVPFALDVCDGSAWISLVAFVMRNLRFRAGGHWTRWLTTPIATHPFLNVRTHVRHRGEPGIYFLAEFLTNRLAVLLGPPLYGLPYRFADNRYTLDKRAGRMSGTVALNDKAQLVFAAQ